MHQQHNRHHHHRQHPVKPYAAQLRPIPGADQCTGQSEQRQGQTEFEFSDSLPEEDPHGRECLRENGNPVGTVGYHIRNAHKHHGGHGQQGAATSHDIGITGQATDQ